MGRLLTKKSWLPSILLFITLVLSACSFAGARERYPFSTPAVPQSNHQTKPIEEWVSEEDLALAQKYAPILYFHPAELFRPQSIEVMVNSSMLRKARQSWLSANTLSSVTINDLIHFQDPSYMLDAWLGDAGSSDYKNYSAHRLYYENVLSPEAGGPPIVSYVHIVRDEEPGYITLQYWLFYYYNDWFNKHEGDWEMVEVILAEPDHPQWVVLSQHHGGTRRAWDHTPIEDDTHPLVFVALGSHANYFWGDESYWNGTVIGNLSVSIMDRTGTFGRVLPQVQCIPDAELIEADPLSWAGFEWLTYGGRWGELAPHGDFSGPYGPAQKGVQWLKPYAWGLAQPLDQETWYDNRLQITAYADGDAEVWITLPGLNEVYQADLERIGSGIILHEDPPPDTPLVAHVQIPAGTSFDLHIRWPNPERSQITTYDYQDLTTTDAAVVKIILANNALPRITLENKDISQQVRFIDTSPAVWDAPDLVWLAGLLPTPDILKGLVICLLAGWLPTLVYVLVLYQSDRYEREPRRLVAAAFFWGSIPAILIALATRLFFQLPVDMIGPSAIEAIRAGVVAPVIEEAVKGIVVLLIAMRFRDEFDNLFDGILYGAMVGFGFAMTGNILSYLGAFLTRGFAGLSETIFVEGVLYGLNHGLYTAIFGAGLGYARLAKKTATRIWIPIMAFMLAVITHAVHNLAIHYLPGQTLLSAVLTWLGIILLIIVMTWSLQRQKQCLQEEMKDEIPADLYQSLITPGGIRLALWRAFKLDGMPGLRRERRTHQVCAELAFKKMQFRLHPEEELMGRRVHEHRAELHHLLEQRT